jgi:adenosylcobinamide hydrolase
MNPEICSSGEEGGSLPVLVWRLPALMRCIASAVYGGGLGLRRWVLNAQVDHGYSRVDPDRHVRELAASLGLRGRGVGMLTAADLGGLCRSEDDGVRVTATVGLGQPVLAAASAEADPRAFERHLVGTINVVATLPEPLSDAALVNAVSTATEAKAQALAEAGFRATGTATDSICILCPDEGTVSVFGGPRSRWGAPLARAVYGAVLSGASDWAEAPIAGEISEARSP